MLAQAQWLLLPWTLSFGVWVDVPLSLFDGGGDPKSMRVPTPRSYMN